MNKKIKELAFQAGLVLDDGEHWFSAIQKADVRNVDLERFAELIRQDETKACAEHYLSIMRDAVEQAVLKEREACAVLVEGGNHVHPKAPDAVWAKTVARLIRARGNHETT